MRFASSGDIGFPRTSRVEPGRAAVGDADAGSAKGQTVSNPPDHPSEHSTLTDQVGFHPWLRRLLAWTR